MVLITRDGSGQLPDSYLILSNTAVTDQLVLSEFLDSANAYQSERDEYVNADGRSLVGAVRVKGKFLIVNKPRRWRCNLLANTEQVALFETLLNAQPGNTSYLLDYWDGPNLAKPVFINVGDRYASRVAQDWYLLQFEALEEI
jgi:hypothetical protein